MLFTEKSCKIPRRSSKNALITVIKNNDRIIFVMRNIFYRLSCVLSNRKDIIHYCLCLENFAPECNEYLKRLHSNMQIKSKFVSVVRTSLNKLSVLQENFIVAMKKVFLIIVMLMVAVRMDFHAVNGFDPSGSDDEVSVINSSSYANVLENICRSCKWRK